MKAKKLALLVAILLVMDLFPFLPGNQPLVHSARAAERSRIVPEIPTIRGGVAGRAKSANDTTYIFGGPGTLAGKFQNAFGQPDRQGWLGVDRTDQEFYWHRDTFHAADLDPTTPDNHAWWCGTTFEPCDEDDPPAGYGNMWEQFLDWYGTVPDPNLAVTVRVTARLNLDCEVYYDHLGLQHAADTEMQTVWTLDGTVETLDFDESFIVTPAHFTGPGANQIHLRWEFNSDFAYSDEDCAWPTDFGAAQIDLIAVTFDQGSGPMLIGPIESWS